eukprot:gene3659-4005_t
MSFIVNHEWHEMLRPAEESVQKTLKRLQKTLEKALKDKKPKKTKAAVHEAAQCQPADVLRLRRPQHCACACEEVDPASLTNRDLETGMEIVASGLCLEVVVNPPSLGLLATFPRAHFTVGYPIAPVATTEFATHFTCQWLLEASSGSGEYEVASTEKVFYPSEGSVGRKVKLVCTPHRHLSDSCCTGRSRVFYLANEVLPSARTAIPRIMEIREAFYRNSSSAIMGEGLRCLSFNILSEGYAQREHSINTLYWYCKPSHLELEYRGQLVLWELLHAQADVIALQECDRKLFESYLLPVMGYHGYDGHFTNKVSMVQEGCAIFVLRSRLAVIQWLEIPYKRRLRREHCPLAAALYSVRPDLEDIVGGKLGTVAQIAVLQCREQPQQVLMVANTHLFYHPLACYIRLMQCTALTACLAELKDDIESSKGVGQRPLRSPFEDPIDPHILQKEFALTYSLAGPEQSSNCISLEPLCPAEVQPSVSVVIMGDFNCSPRSVGFEFLSSGKVSEEKMERAWKDLHQFFWGDSSSSLEEEEEVSAIPNAKLEDDRKGKKHAESDIIGPNAVEAFAHSLHLMDSTENLGYHERYSNFTPDYRDLLDHIFIQKEKLEVEAIGPQPSIEQLEEETALPSSCFPSDHVSVVVDLRFKTSSS